MNSPLNIIFPAPPVLPDPEPPVIELSYDYVQLKAYRLLSQPYIVRASYDTVQMMIDERILRKLDNDYIDWLIWVRANL